MATQKTAPKTDRHLSKKSSIRKEQLDRRNRAISAGMCKSKHTKAVCEFYGSLVRAAAVTGYSPPSLSFFLRHKRAMPASVLKRLQRDMPGHDFSVFAAK